MSSAASASAAAAAQQQTVSPLETMLLEYLDDNGADASIADSLAWLESRQLGDQHDKFIGVLTSLAGFALIQMRAIDHARTDLTAEGERYRVAGTPEGQLFASIPAEGAIAQKDLEEKLGKAVLSLGLAKCMSNKWIEFEGDKKLGMLKRKVPSAVDEVQQALQALKDGAEVPSADLLKKRGLIETRTWKTYAITRGDKFVRVRKLQSTDLTVDMLKGDKWKELEFKEYNFEAASEGITHGTLHPLMKVRGAFRQIFIEMGFEEMPTNKYVESSFWNFDTLFQPQQHPARDAHDTFFIHEPARTLRIPEEYLAATKAMHETGGFGSRGYRYDWKREESEKNILRTHTTACSSRMLYKLAQDCAAGKPFKPRRYFSIDRVFRNETLDATHLAEFYQIEGLIADRNLTLGDLIGTIATFFKRLGLDDVRFKPAYNPYTEPSMEIFGFSPQLGKDMELGNSGMFRPEMLRPMGLPEDVRVIAWGFGLERQTMLVYGVKHIRDIFGPKVKLDAVQRNPICRFDRFETTEEDEVAAAVQHDQ